MRVLGLDAHDVPVVLAPAALVERWPGLGSEFVHGRVSTRKVGGQTVLVLGRLTPAVLLKAGALTVVAGMKRGLDGPEDPRVALAAFHLGLIGQWRRSRIHTRMAEKDLVLFSNRAPGEALPITVQRGELELWVGRGERKVKLYPHLAVPMEYQAVCIGDPPEGHDRPLDEPAPPLVPTAAQLKEAERVKFLQALFGPMILLPASLVGVWEGTPSVHEKGPRPFRDAQRVREAGIITVDDHEAVVLEPHGAAGILPRPDGMLLISWQGAHDEKVAAITAMTVPEDAYRKVGTLHVIEREVVMFDAGVAGRKLDPWDRISAVLPATGTYEVSSILLHGADVELDGKINMARVGVVRLRRV